MRYRIGLLLILLLALLPSIVLSEELLTNDSIIRMHSAGLSSAVIIAKIQETPTDFDTSVDGLVALAESGVPDEVIAAMTGAEQAEVPRATPQATPQRDTVVLGHQATAVPTVRAQFNDARCAGPGIFAELEDGSTKELEPSTYSGSKSSGLWKTALTYGIASTKSKSMIQGLTSQNRVHSRSPTFYFCFEEAESGLSYETHGATTPSQFLLVKLDVKEKQNARLVVTGKFSTFSGGYAGPPAKYRKDFTSERLAPGVYKVSVNGLTPGEYAFFYTGSASAMMATTYGLVASTGGGKVFDFCVG